MLRNIFQIAARKRGGEWPKRCEGSDQLQKTHPNEKEHPLQTFDNFQLSASKQNAFNASKAVATNPQSKYPSVFIYGKSGLGKGHLLHAIKNELNQTKPDLKVKLISAKDLILEMNLEPNKKNPVQYKSDILQTTDVLLVNDIQEFEHAKNFQEIFLSILDSFHEHKKQLVLTSIKNPKNLIDLSTLLISRLQWGIVVSMNENGPE